MDQPPGSRQIGNETSDLMYNLSGVYTLDGETATISNGVYTSDTTDVSAVYVKEGGDLMLIDPAITTSGNTSSNSASSFYGLNAAVLADSAGTIHISGGIISTTGSGANGAFSSGSGSSVTLSGTVIHATGDGGHGIMTSNGGLINLSDVRITTSGTHGAPIATDRGGGRVVVDGGSMTSSGADSPGVYSTGDITITGARIVATGAEAAVVEGSNSITLTDTTLEGAAGSRLHGILVYQSMSGDASSGTGKFTMEGGSYTFSSTEGPAFYVTNTRGEINLTGVAVNSRSSVLLKAGSGDWGSTGSNGGRAVLLANNVNLTGSLVSDENSTITASLRKGTVLTGAINSASLALDASSMWQVTGESVLTSLADADGISGTVIKNIAGNGYNVYYDPGLAENNALDGKTFSLLNGGNLIPRAVNTTTNRQFTRDMNRPSPPSRSTRNSHNTKGTSQAVGDSLSSGIGSIPSSSSGSAGYESQVALIHTAGSSLVPYTVPAFSEQDINPITPVIPAYIQNSSAAAVQGITSMTSSSLIVKPRLPSFSLTTSGSSEQLPRNVTSRVASTLTSPVRKYALIPEYQPIP